MKTPDTYDLSQEEIEYLQKHPMCKKLTIQDLDCEALWSTHLGARTIRDAIDTEKVYSEFRRKEAEAAKSARPPIQVSEEMARRNERCIDEFSCSEAIW